MQFSKIDSEKIKLKRKVYWYGFNYLYKFLPIIVEKKIKKIFSKKLFFIQKGFDITLKNNGDDFYFKVVNDIENTSLNIDKNKFSKVIFGEYVKDKELLIKQFIISYFFHPMRREISIPREILKSSKSKKKIIYPIDIKFITIFEKNKILVNKLLSFFLWYFFIILYYLNGIRKILLVLLKFIINYDSKFKRGIFFSNLPKEALNLNKNYNIDENYFSFIYLYFKKNKLSFSSIIHSLKNVPNFKIENVEYSYGQKFDYRFRNNQKIVFFLWALKSILLSLFDLFKGRWWHALLLGEAVDRKIVEISDEKKLHQIYSFNNTDGLVYKPMWTYEAKNKGSKSIFYFYSLNFLPLTKIKICPEGFSLINWDYFSVWGKNHESYLKKNIKNKFDVISYKPIFLNTGYIEFKIPKEKFVTIFDITPARPIFRKSNYFSSEFADTKNVIKFIDDIIKISKIHNVKVILKNKRLSGNSDKKYLNYLNKQIISNNLLLLNENVSSISLIKSSKLIISYPLTSISKLSSYFNISNFYYSPIDINIDKERLLGSEILYKKDELDKLFSNTFDT